MDETRASLPDLVAFNDEIEDMEIKHRRKIESENRKLRMEIKKLKGELKDDLAGVRHWFFIASGDRQPRLLAQEIKGKLNAGDNPYIFSGNFTPSYETLAETIADLMEAEVFDLVHHPLIDYDIFGQLDKDGNLEDADELLEYIFEEARDNDSNCVIIITGFEKIRELIKHRCGDAKQVDAKEMKKRKFFYFDAKTRKLS